MKTDKFRIRPDRKVRLKDHDPSDTLGWKNKDAAEEKLGKDVERLAELQEVLYAQDRWSLLLMFQAMDAAGKDGAIKHVMSGVNPQGCQVASFKAPSAEDLDHDFLWRCQKHLPERGRIGIFNRSWYEEMLVVRVHPNILEKQQVPAELVTDKIWKQRAESITDFEKHLSRNGTKVIKFFLNVSRDEQKKRFLDRIDKPEKNWKMSPSDAVERGHWDEYQEAYEDVLSWTSTERAPWYVIPADNKWFSRMAVAHIVVKTLEEMDLKYPEVGKDRRRALLETKKMLEAEED
ncbi:MAG: polyphosphate kinase 2 family protein [Fibrobacterota bacterium]|nr:MAG: polyphosphate kinase 2 family protein [Fibrobacterota bacterium]